MIVSRHLEKTVERRLLVPLRWIKWTGPYKPLHPRGLISEEAYIWGGLYPREPTSEGAYIRGVLYLRGLISKGAYIWGGLYPRGLISEGHYIRGGLYLRGLISEGAYIRGGLYPEYKESASKQTSWTAIPVLIKTDIVLYLRGLISKGAYIWGAYTQGALYPRGLISEGAWNPKGLISDGAYIRGVLYPEYRESASKQTGWRVIPVLIKTGIAFDFAGL